jgi:hypothetical protein
MLRFSSHHVPDIINVIITVIIITIIVIIINM